MKQTVYNGKVVEVMDCTPTWAALLPALIDVIENTSGDGRRLAKEELKKMAAVADKMVEATKLLNECDTAFAVLFIGSDHGITPQADQACREAGQKIQTLLQSLRG